MRVLLAPGPFSGALDAVEAAAAMRRGWLRQAPTTSLVERPMSDGGSELLAVVHAARGGRLISLTAAGPTGSTVPASLLHVPGAAGGSVYLDASQVLGTHLTGPGQALEHAVHGTSRGIGELLLAALELGASRVVLGLGEAASHDAGAGVLAVLGGDDADLQRSLDAARRRVSDIDLVVAVSHDVPLLGLHGAGALLADRPGVGPAEAQRLDTAVGERVAALERAWARLAPLRPSLGLAGDAPAGHDHGHGGRRRPGRADGSGAGGGVAYLLDLLGARVLPGAEVVAGGIDLAGAVGQVDLVVGGLAVLDGAALDGGILPAVTQAAMPLGLPVVVLAEEVHTSRRELAGSGISTTYEIGTHPDGVLAALEAWAQRAARTWARSA